MGGEVRAQRELAISHALSNEDRERVAKRYERQQRDAERFLRADDEPEDRRTRLQRIRASLVFIEGYRELPLLAWPREVLDAIVELEQRFTIFRQRHARMVERMIGRRTGTGGSAGVAYLDETALKYRVFSEVWAVRSLLLRAEAMPTLFKSDFYGFVDRPGGDGAEPVKS